MSIHTDYAPLTSKEVTFVRDSWLAGIELDELLSRLAFHGELEKLGPVARIYERLNAELSNPESEWRISK